MAEKLKLRVLLIEDEAIVAMNIEDMLVELGFEIAAIAGRVPEAMNLAERDDVDLAILDRNLDGESTDGVARLLSARGVPFIFATGYGEAGRAGEFPAAPWVQKPFQKQHLAAAIARAVAGD